jgi:ligand-binding sensor domain-containing protein
MRSFIAFLFTLFCLTISAQDLYFTNIGTKQGLPSSETYHLLQDSKGYIWITSDGGICRYDGESFKTYTTRDGLPENVVFKIYEDRHGRIWFNTLSGNFFYFENEIFHSIAANAELQKLSKSFYATQFFIGENDTLNCENDRIPGIIKIPPQDNYKNVIRQNRPNFTSVLINNKLCNKEFIMISRVGKPSPYPKFDTIYSTRNKRLDILNSLKKFEAKGVYFVDNKNNIYIAHGTELRVIRESNDSIEYYNLPSLAYSIYQDVDNDLWFSTNDGVYLYKRSDLQSKPIHFLKGIIICNIIVDREKNIWASSLQKGLFKSINKELVDLYLEKENITNFSKDENGLHIYFSSNKELFIDKNNSISNLPFNKQLLSKTNKLSYCKINNDYTYYGTQQGLFWAKDKKVQPIEDNECKLNSTIYTKKIIKIGADSFAVLSTLILHFIHKEKVYNRIEPTFFPRSLIQLKDKTLLIGSRNNDGVYALKNNLFVPYLKQYPQLKTRINELVEDAKNNLWIATNEKGLFCYANNKLYEYNETNGLISNKVNTIDFENDGTIWIGTNKGISKIVVDNNLGKAKIYNFNNSHGLPHLEIDQLTIFNNKVWCACKEHLFYFDCDKMNINKVPPFVYIKSILVNDTLFNAASAPTLNYNQNNISFKFDGITYKNPEQKSFLYKLSGYENQWKSSNTTQIQYTNLPYGDYTFEIYALNNDGIKSITPASFKFTILKPFWFTWWFILTEVILFSFIVYLFIRWRINKIKKREEEKTDINKKLAEFQMTAIRAQMNPHFIFNAMNSIQNFIQNKDASQASDYLLKFSKLLRFVLNNSKDNEIPLQQEIDTLDLYIELEKLRFNNPFDYHLEIDKQLDTEQVMIPALLIQPYIENAIWHGLMPLKERKGILSLIIKQDDKLLKITVADNGIGRKASDLIIKKIKHQSMGMALNSKRVELFGQGIEYASITIIDLYDAEDKANGTKLEITLPLLEAY